MDKKMFIIDWIEEESIVLEDYEGEIIVIDKDKVKSIPLEGDILVKDGDLFFVDIEETRKRREKIKNIMKGMWDE